MKFLPLLFLLILTVGLAEAGDESQINDLLKNGGNVTLENRVYEITGPIYIYSNTVLTGGSDTVIRVSSGISSPWFSPYVAVINILDPYNVKITGFEVDGNCQSLPSGWADSAPEHEHDQEQLIKVTGSSGNFGSNIEISNMKLHNSFGDGIKAACIDGIICEGNEIINTQHESIYFSACKNCKMLNNKMAVITSDGGRFDNCINGEAEGNIVWMYNGPNANGAYIGGANGFQAGNAGSSKGYDGRKSWISTQNVEIHDNIISDPGRQGILISNADTDSANIFVHDNTFKNTSELRTMGIPVDDNYSVENPPSLQESENVFESIFDILNLNFISSGLFTNKTIYINGTRYNPSEAPRNATYTIEQHPLNNYSYTLVYGPSEGLTKVRYEANGKKAEHFYMIGEVEPLSILYTPVNSWNGELSHMGDALHLDEVVDPKDIKITCYSPVGSFEPSIKVIKIEQPEHLFNPLLKYVFFVMFGAFAYIYLTIKYS